MLQAEVVLLAQWITFDLIFNKKCTSCVTLCHVKQNSVYLILNQRTCISEYLTKPVHISSSLYKNQKRGGSCISKTDGMYFYVLFRNSYDHIQSRSYLFGFCTSEIKHYMTWT